MTTTEELATTAGLPALRPGEDGYDAAVATVTGTGTPDLVVQPRTAAEVATAVRLARAHQLTLTVRSGGHSMAGLSRPASGLLLDLARIADITVDPASRITRIGAGARWGAVAEVLGRYGLGITAGDTASVGVGGLTLGGGIGWLVRRYGLAIDNLVGAEVVTAAGAVLEVSAEQHHDLFWSLRGGGAGTAVVTRFDFRAHPVSDVLFGTITLAADDPLAVLKGWRDVQRGADERLTTVVSLLPAMGERPGAVMVQVCFDGPEEDVQDSLDRLRELAPVLGTDLAVRPYAGVLEEADPPHGMRVAVTNTFLDLSDAALAALAALYTDGGTVVALRALGGAVARVGQDATAFAHRRAEAMAIAVRFSPTGAGPAPSVPARWRAVAACGNGTYVNFRSEADAGVLASAYPPATRQRLARTRAEYDPEGVLG